jgi:hypothetical protein
MLMHEAGHAAHFANIKQPSPSSVKNAPTSVGKFHPVISVQWEALAFMAGW